MHSLLTMVTRKAFGDRMSPDASCHRMYDSCTTSSASATLPSMRYAIENSRRRCASNAANRVFSSTGSLELEDPFAAKRAADAVVEAAERAAVDVALVVARVEGIGDVEHLQADCGVVTEHAKLLGHLRVERDESRIAARLISRSDEVPISVDRGQRESGPHVENREQREAARQREA